MKKFQLNNIFRQKTLRLWQLFFVICLTSFTQSLFAQTPQFYNTDATATTNAFPLNSTTSNKAQWIYAPGVFNSAGTTGSPAYYGNITTVYIKVGTASATATYTNFYIKLGQNVGTATNFGTTSNTAYPFNTGLTTCFYAATHQLTGIVANTWYPITLQTPFTYDPSLALIMEIQVSSGTGNGVSQVTTSGQMQRCYGLYSNPNGTSNTALVKLGFDLVSSSPCTSPPTPGTSTASLSSVCSSLPTILNLTGNSVGSGQTYQWQSSSTLAGPYTNIGSSSSTSALTVNPTSSTYYRCELTCSGLSDYSTPVLVSVPTPFPGGSYTINSALPTGGTNFQSFTDAVSAISCGISGPVVFDVDPASGPYNEQITLPFSIGSNAVNTVTFNGNGRTIQFASTNTNARHVIKLDGADYITFNDLNIVSTTGTYGWGMHFTNGADYNTVSLCNITTSITDNTSSAFQPIVMSGSATSATTAGNNGSNNTFIDNTLIGGYYGVTLCGAGTGTENSGNNFTSNTIRDFYGYGIYMIYQKGSTVSTCDLSRPNRTASTTTAGVYMTTSAFGNTVENNRIHNYFDAMTTSTSTFYGIYESASGTATDISKVVNNVIYDINSAGSIYGVYNSGAAYQNIYHNTISLDYVGATAGLAYGIYQTTAATNINVRNNIITISRGGTGAKVGLYYNTNTSGIISNNNVVFLNSAGTGTQSYGNSGATGFATLTAWQAANGGVYDANSVDFNPVYTSPGTGDFTPTAITTNNIGANVGVLFDIVGNPRSATPDPGAYEYTLVGLDAGITWVSPTSPTTPGLHTISVSISNNLSTPITSLELSYTDGGTPVTETFTGLSIAPSTSQTMNFTVQYNVNGNSVLYAYINSVNGGLDDAQSNDTTNNINLCVSMSGAYTVNAGAPVSATNFQSFTALAATLTCGGVTGPVTVDVVSGSGPYNEQVSFGVIPGSSFVNTVTINGNNNTLTFPSGTDYFTLRLNGSDNMTWNNLNITSTGASNGIALNMTNASDFNTFNNCNFSASTTITASASSCVAFSSSSVTATGSGNNGNNNIFSNCSMTGGYYCVSVYGNTTANITGNQFLGCTIKEYYIYGLYNAYAGTTIVRDCIFERPTRTSVSTGYGVYLTTSSSNCLIERNRVRKLFGGVTTSTSTGYGLACIVAASVGNENKFINNVISDIQHNGALYGVYLSSASYSQVYHNTISLDATAATGTTTTYGIYSTGTAGVDCRSNIVSISRGGTGSKFCAYYSPISAVTSNNNDFFMNSTAGTNYVAYDGTTNFATLAAYQTVNTTKDQLSVSIDPGYSNPAIGNYQPTEATMDNLGANVGVTLDVNSVTRGAIPDMGAYEFSVAALDAGAFAFLSPGTSGCYTNSETISVTIKNYGSTTIDFSVNPLTVNCDITGAVTTTLSATPSGTLATGATMTVNLGPALDMTVNGTYNMNIYTVLSGDGNSANDVLSPAVSRIVGPVGGTITSTLPSICVSGTPTLNLSGSFGGTIQWQESTVGASGPWTNIGTGTTSYTPSSAVTQTTYYQVEVSCNGNISTSNTYTLSVNNPILFGTTPATRCGVGTVTLGATVSPGNTANWYTTATGGIPIASGTSFTTPTISSTTNFYVAATSGGLTTNVGRASNLTPSDGTNTGTNTVGIMFDAIAGLTINSVLVYPYSATAGTAGTITIGLQTSAGVTLQTATVAVTGNPTPIGQTVPLNFNVPPGTGYRLLWMTPNVGVTALYREFTATPFNFPYTLPGVISLTSSYTSGASLAYYYYFYDWSISTGCEGPRTSVTATVTAPPAITASAADPILCPSASTTVSVSSPNDPNYTYDWTSSPGAFTATGAGPHTVSPTTTTIYTVTATDNSTGPNAGCANVATVTITTAPAITAGTLSTSINSYCVSGSPVLNVAGAAGGLINFQSSSSATGPWTTVSSGTASTYTPSSPLTATTYFRVEVTCGSGSDVSNVLTITVSSPQVLTTIPGSRCGIGTVTLGATVDAGVSAKWYAAATGGPVLGTGTSFTTPTISTTTSFYVEPLEGIGGADSVAVPLANGTTTGSYHHMFVVNSPTGLSLNAIGIKCNNTIGTLTAWDIYYRPDNYQTVSGANTSSTGWTLLTSTTNVASLGATDYTYISLGNNLTLPPGAIYSFYVAPASGSTHQYATTAIGTTVVSNANASIIAGNRGSTLFNCTASGGMAIVKLKYSLGCVGTRVPVLATINTPPVMTVTTADPTLCPGGTTTVGVSSPNPDYTYSWTSDPSGFVASGTGPHTVSPTITTKYYVSAIDNSTGTYAGCANLDSVTVITAATLSAGTVSSSSSTICISGAPTLTNTGSSGGAIQWQESIVSASGPWTNVGTGATTYNPGTITQTSYYRAEVACQSTAVQSNVVTVTVNDPMISSTTPAVVCGTSGSAVISATAAAGTNIKWYDVATGGTSLGTGASFTTPTISSTTTFYAEPNIGGAGGTASPIQVTEMDLGTNDQLEIQNVSPDPIDVTGWKVAIGNSYSDITSVNANVQTLSGIMAPGATMKWTDATAGPNYWGSNILWNPGAFPTYAGWAAILDNNNILKDIVFLNWPSANIAAASITVGTTVITVGSLWTGNGIDQTTVAATNSVSRQGTSDNNNASDFAIIPLSLNSTNPGMTLPFTGFGCVGTRVPVVVTVGPCNSELNLSLFIQGYYDGSIGGMLPVLANQFEPTTANACDTIDVELRDAASPYGVIQSVRTILNQNGTANCIFPPVTGSYYVAVKHRNGLQTWSANPISFATSPATYNFTTAASQAYGDNQTEVAPGVWAFYSGDVVIDENLDLLDISAVETDINNFGFGYLPTDINGDGNVDLLDSPPVETNINNFVFSIHP